jgi:hypothetical protein
MHDQVLVSKATNAVVYATHKSFLVCGPPQASSDSIFPTASTSTVQLLTEQQASFLDRGLDAGIITNPFYCRLVLLPLQRRKDKPISPTKVCRAAQRTNNAVYRLIDGWYCTGIWYELGVAERA